MKGERDVTPVVAVIHEENGVFGVSFPDFPGCVTGADTFEDAVRKAREALAFHVAGMASDGDPIPTNFTVDDRRSRRALDGMPIIVRVGL